MVHARFSCNGRRHKSASTPSHLVEQYGIDYKFLLLTSIQTPKPDLHKQTFIAKSMINCIVCSLGIFLFEEVDNCVAFGMFGKSGWGTIY
jgi:hypothetical protein